MLRPKRERTRAVNWAGKPSREAQAAHDEYVQHLKRTGVLPWADDDAWYAAGLPDPEVRHEP